MSYKPILFSVPMVQAILDYRKTQTRRVVKQVTSKWEFIELSDDAVMGIEDKNGDLQPIELDGTWATFNDGEFSEHLMFRAKYQIGDILWVRETTYLYGKWIKNGLTKKGKQKYKFVWDKLEPVYYAADSRPDSVCTRKDQVGYFKRPSIFMPKQAARIFIKVTDARVDRVQGISEEDANAEGITSYWAEPHRDTPPFIGAAKEIGADLCYTRKEAFQQLWDSLNAERGYGWNTNPWVWVYTFERVDKPGGGLIGAYRRMV